MGALKKERCKEKLYTSCFWTASFGMPQSANLPTKKFYSIGELSILKKKKKKKISALILPITNPSLWWKYIRRWAQKDRSACDLNASYSKYHSDDPITLTLNFRVKNLVATYHINLPWLMLIQTDKCSSNDWIDHIWAWWCSEVQRDA